MPRVLPDDLQDMPRDERVELIDALWVSLEQDQPPLTRDIEAELHRRVEALDRYPSGLRSWPDVRADLRRRLR